MKQRIYSELTIKSRTELFILFHGMFGSSNAQDIKATKKVLVKNGFSVLCFDYPGHGKSDGNINNVSLSMIIESSKALSQTIEKYQRIYLIGFSFGAYPSIHLASKNKKVKGIILFNPATDIIKLIFRKKTYDDLDNYVDSHRKISTSTKIKSFIGCLIFNNYSKAKRIRCPIYVYHIKDDRTVPVTQSKKLEGCINSKKKFVYAKGNDHSLSKEIKKGEFEKKILPSALKWILENQ
ncbi:MAG: alpha/beta hydrolase [Candidatus Woesearchaeota archaeon]|nr:alpha/beta hydrolase [Candidatus Woesearchaeota archaeon]